MILFLEINVCCSGVWVNLGSLQCVLQCVVLCVLQCVLQCVLRWWIGEPRELAVCVAVCVVQCVLQ